MKILIVTIWDNGNCGNRLQNYALQEVLIRLGHEVFTAVVDRHGMRLRNRVRREGRRILARLGMGRKSDLVQEPDRSRAGAAFSREYIRNTIYVGNCSRAFRFNWTWVDCGIAGSDQIWHRWHPEPVYRDPAELVWYGLRFLPEKKRVAYAASFGWEVIPAEMMEEYRSMLNGYAVISVRERSAARLVRELTGREAACMPDPALLLDAAQWEALERRPDIGRHFGNVSGEGAGSDGKRLYASEKRQGSAGETLHASGKGPGSAGGRLYEPGQKPGSAEERPYVLVCFLSEMCPSAAALIRTRSDGDDETALIRTLCDGKDDADRARAAESDWSIDVDRAGFGGSKGGGGWNSHSTGSEQYVIRNAPGGGLKGSGGTPQSSGSEAGILDLSQLKDIGPAEFLWLIHHATRILTDSFHAAVFALLFHRPVTVFRRTEGEMDDRIRTLAGMLGLEPDLAGSFGREAVRSDLLGCPDRGEENCPDRLLRTDADTDYSALEERLAERRREAIAFLTEALRQAAALQEDQKV